jgi:DNA-binding GntR family transcriptional regulator
MPVPEQRGAVRRQLLRDSAYAALCEAIVSGELEPGETLNDEALCAWLGVSRTPVREALARLAERGLVELAPQRHTRVAPLTAQEARQTVPVVAALHALAIEAAVPRLGRADLERIQRASDAFWEAVRAGDIVRSHAADERFHALFVLAAANREIERVLRLLGPRLRRLLRQGTRVPPGRRAVAEHQAMLARAATGDAAGAASAARAHWLSLGAAIERSLAARAAS